MASIKFVGARVWLSREDVAVIVAIYVSYDCGIDPRIIEVKFSSDIVPPIEAKSSRIVCSFTR